MHLVAASFVAALCYATTASAQPIASAPTFKVGDRWVFAEVDDKGAVMPWLREVVSVTPQSMEVRAGSGRAGLYDLAMNVSVGGHLDRLRVLAKYPMSVGDSWRFSIPGDTPDWAETGSVSVEAFEEVVVPAGAFACYRVSAETTRGAKSYGTYTRWTRWYCPAIKWMAKEERIEMTRDTGNPANNRTRTVRSELQAFVPGK